ncbi:MAG TPA: hypothetical protein VIJ39_12290 [Solirubrobacteraceae bacterium]
MSDLRTIPLAVTLNGRQVDSETTCVWAGPHVLVIATVLPDHGLALELDSIFVGHEGVPTCVTHLTLGPVGENPVIVPVEHEHASLNPKLKARDCAYEHAEIVLETLNRLGYEAGINMPDDAFEELERVER